MIFKLNKLLLTVACFLLSSVIFLSYQYIFPYADDWAYTFNLLDKGFVGSQAHYYFENNGRFFSNFIISFNPILLGDFSYYRLMSFVLGPVVFYLSLVTFFKTFFNYNKWFFSFVLFVVFASELPGLSPAFYWYPTVAHYTLGCSLLIFYQCYLRYYLDNPTKLNHFYSIIMVGLVVGSSEVVMIIAMMVLFSQLALSFLYGWSSFKRLAIQLIYYFGFSAIVLLCPGIAKRAAHSENSKNIAYTFLGSLDHSFLTIKSWNEKYTFILLSLLVVGYLWKYRDKLSKLEFFNKSFYLNPLVYIIVLFGFYWLSYIPFFWGVGFPPRPRYENVPYTFYFFIHLFITVVLHAYCLKFERYKKILNFIFGFQWSYLIVSLLLIVSLTQKRTYKDCRKQYWSGDMKSFSMKMDNQFKLLKENRNNVIEPIENRPFCIVPYPIRYNDKINVDEYIDYLSSY